MPTDLDIFRAIAVVLVAHVDTTDVTRYTVHCVSAGHISMHSGKTTVVSH